MSSGSAGGPGSGTPTAVEVVAPAKINLHLRVLERLESGFHSIETVLQAVELSDRVRIRSDPDAPGVRLVVEGPSPGPDRENLVSRAALAFLERAGDALEGEVGVEITLTKRIPMGAGLGGGSSDAAATLRALAVLFPGAVPTGTALEIGARLGSDVPFFFLPTAHALAWGRGERLLPLGPGPSRVLVLALPSLRVDTGRAYRELARTRKEARAVDRGEEADTRPVILPRELLEGGAAGHGVNDFEPVVFRLHPNLAELRREIEAAGARPARLTGSGAALFGVFPDLERAREAAGVLGDRFPGVRFVVSRTLGELPPVRPL